MSPERQTGLEAGEHAATPVRLRSALEMIPSYQAGKPARVAAEVDTYKLSSNENPYPPLPSVAEVIAQVASHVHRYPDMASGTLVERLSRRFDVAPDTIALGTGSVGVLGQIITAVCDDGDEVVFAWRSFEAYPIVTAVAGATPVPVPLRADGTHDVAAMAAAIGERTKVVLMCTPNNPTGPVVDAGELAQFLGQVPESVLVVIDEAYVEFVTAHTAPDSLALWRRHRNVVVLRTFSKAYGLAGLRVGYAIAHPPVAAALRKTAVPFGVNSIAQAAAVASLDAEDELRERVAALIVERDRVCAALADQGWQLPDAQGNFVWFPLGSQTASFADTCERSGLAVRPFGGDGVRVTIGETAANDRLLQVAAAFRADQVPATKQ